MRKPKTQIAKAKEDIKALETAMNAGQIPKRESGREIEAATESGARVTIESGGRKVETTVSGLKRAAKAIQTEAAALVPPLDGVGKAANNFAHIVKQLADLSEQKGDAESKLIAALKRAKRTSIKVEGYALFLKHNGPVDKIQVQKPK